MRSRTAPVPLCRVVAVTVLVAGAALLVGCSPEPGTVPSSPTTSPRSTASAAASPTPSPTPTMPAPAPSPTPPPEMSRDDEAGAVAAATYFLTELYPYTVTQQETSELQAVSHPDCKFCATTVHGVQSEISAGRVTHPGQTTVLSASAHELNPLAFEIQLEIAQAADTVWSTNGTQVGSNQRRELVLAVFVLWQGDHWILRGVDVLFLNGEPQ